jgi:hypothetical protein
VEAHGGSIGALNNSKGGATFRIVLPLLTFTKGQQEEPGPSVTTSTRKITSTAGSTEMQRPAQQLSANRAVTEQVSASSANKKT